MRSKPAVHAAMAIQMLMHLYFSPHFCVMMRWFGVGRAWVKAQLLALAPS